MERSLSQNLKKALDVPEGSSITLKSILDNVAEEGFGLLLMLMSLPSALPIPAAGYSTPFGILFMLLGIQMLAGRHEPWLPKWALERKMSKSFADKTIGSAAKFFGWIEKVIKPRLQWINSRTGIRFMSAIVVFMGALMTLPIPLTNTAPAAVIFLIGAGLSEKDGLFSIGACILGCAAVLLYAGVIYIVVTEGPDKIMEVKDWIVDFVKDLFSSGEASPVEAPSDSPSDISPEATEG